jgi:hypothetical protein
MRETVRDYVRAVHASYLDTVRHLPPAERGALPLVSAEGVTVLAAASRRLHLVATTDRLPGPRGPEVAVVDDHAGTRWTVRFFDPSVLPDLGILAEDTPEEVRRVLGVSDTVYHLTVEVGGGLTEHHAQHSGVALAHLHTKRSRDLDRLRHALPQQARVVDELGACARLGLDRAASLLATELTSGRVVPLPGTSAEACLEAVLETVLADVRRR